VLKNEAHRSDESSPNPERNSGGKKMPEIPSTQFLESLKGLSIPERIQIVEDLWDSIAIPQENFGLPEAQARELEKRIDALEKNESPLSSWDEVRHRITNGR